MVNKKELEKRKGQLVRRIWECERRKQEADSREWYDYYSDCIAVYKKHLDYYCDKINGQEKKESVVKYARVFGIFAFLGFLVFFLAFSDFGITGFVSFDGNFSENDSVVGIENDTVYDTNVTLNDTEIVNESINETFDDPGIFEDPLNDTEIVNESDALIDVERNESADSGRINLSKGKMDVERNHEAVVNKEVEWDVLVNLEYPDELASVEVEIPTQAREVLIIDTDTGEGFGEEGFVKSKNGKRVVDLGSVVKGREKTGVIIEYVTEAPKIYVEEIGNGKRVIVSGPDDLGYEDVLAFTSIPEVTNKKSRIKVYWHEEEKYVDFDAFDRNGNGLLDSVEWTVDHLSNQTFDIILITAAEHLDENRDFVSNIFEEVKELDGIWSESIPGTHYTRVTFERNLTNKNDITVYPRTVSGNPRIEIYEKDSWEIIAEFGSLNDNEYNKVYLTNLQGEQDTFDLRIVNGDVEFDHIIDPTGDYQVLGEAGSANVTDSLVWSWISFSETYSSTPVVIATPATAVNCAGTCSGTGSGNGGMYPVPLVKDVSTTGFNFSMCIDGGSTTCTTSASEEAFHYFVFDVDAAADLDWIEVGTTASVATNGADTAETFSTSFAGTPDVWTQAQTYSQNGEIGAHAWVEDNGKTTSGFTYVGCVHTGTGNSCDSNNPAETFGYVAIDTSEADFSSDVNFQFGMADISNSAWTSASFSPTYTSPRVMVTQNDDDGGQDPEYPWARLVTSSSMEFRYCEEDAGDLCNSHTSEKTYWFAMEDGVISVGSDTLAPYVTIVSPLNSTYDVSSVDFNITLDEAGDTAYYTLDNGVNNVTMTKLNSTSFNYTNSSIGDGGYIARFYVNDTLGNLNNTETIIFSVSTAASDDEYPIFSGYLEEPSNNTAYVSGGFYEFNATITSTNASVGLEFNGVNYTASNLTSTLFNVTLPIDLGVGTYPYYWFGWGNGTDANYNNSDLRYYTVSKATGDVEVYLDGTAGNITVESGSDVTFNASVLAGEFSAAVYNDSVLVANGTATTNITGTIGVGSINITAVLFASQNYTGEILERWIDVEDTTIPLIDFDSTTPENYANFTGNRINISVDVTELNEDEIKFYLYNGTGGIVNISNFTDGRRSLNFTDLGAGNYTYNVSVSDIVGNINSSWRYINLEVENSPPSIISIFNHTQIGGALNEGPSSTSFIVNFSVSDADGASNLDSTTAAINFTRAGEDTRYNSTCAQYQSSGNNANYTCNVMMWWWDGSGAWDINATIRDSSSAEAINDTESFNVALTTGFVLSSEDLTFTGVNPGATNITANEVLWLNNTGNKDIEQTAISVNATSLLGEETSSQALYSGNFSFGNTTGGSAECNYGSGIATRMNYTVSGGSFVNITTAVMNASNYTINNGREGQEQLYLCLTHAGSELSQQSYSTRSLGAWTIRILLVALIPASRKNRKRNRRKKSKKDILRLFERKLKINKIDLDDLLSINDSLRKSGTDIGELLYLSREKDLAERKIKIPVNIFGEDIGAAEALCKYLKENKGMKFSEVSELIGRDQRTIWNNYRNALRKKKERFKEAKGVVYIPISAFDGKLSVLENVIYSLRRKGLRNIDVAEIIHRDPRNVHAVYSKALGKLGS